MRNVTALNAAQLTSGNIAIVWFVSLTFNSGTYYACTAPFSFTWGSFTWEGIGDLGQIGQISEGTEVIAQGTTVTLNAINNALLQDSLNDIGAFLPADIYIGFVSQATMALIDTPIKAWGGIVDAPSISVGPENSSITLTLENRMINLQRGAQRRYTPEDQHVFYPADTAFGWVASLNDVALVWGAVAFACFFLPLLLTYS